MDDTQHKRAKSAIGEDMRIEHLGGSEYEVKEKYTVDPVAGTCECKDFEYRVSRCKHLLRLVLEIEWGNVVEPGTEKRSAGRPQSLIPIYDNVPSYLTERDQWVCWEYKRDTEETHEKDWTKVPIDVNGNFASSTDSDTWVPFEEAVDYDAHNTDRTDGIGFVVTLEDDLIGIDIDDCRDADSGEIVEEVDDLLDKVDSYTEVSPSGTGLRIFVRYDDNWPADCNQSDLIAGDGVEVEVYETGRYLTVTGYHVEGTPREVRNSAETVELFATIMDTSFGLTDA